MNNKPSMKTVLLRVTLLMLFSASTVLAQKPAVFSVEGKAIREYDPVAYFTDGKATAGNTAFT